MKLFSVIALCTVLLFMMLGYSQFKTTGITEMSDEENWAKIIIVEGYVYLAKTTTHLGWFYGFENDYVAIGYIPTLVENSTGLLVGKIPYDRYALLDFGEGRFFPLGKGIFKARVKGEVVIRDCEYDIITMDVIHYGLALQEKINNYKRIRG